MTTLRRLETDDQTVLSDDMVKTSTDSETDRFGSLAEEIVQSPAFDPYRTTSSGGLSKQSHGIVMTTLAIVLGRTTDAARRDAEMSRRERVFDRFWQAYRTPLGPKTLDNLASPDSAPKAKILNWGNFITAGGVVAMCIAIYQTQALTSWRSVAEAREQQLKELSNVTDRLRAEKGEVAGQLASEQTRAKLATESADEWRKQFDEVQKSQKVAKDAAQLQASLNQVQSQLADTKEAFGRAEATAAGEAKAATEYKNQLAEATRERDRERDRANVLDKQVIDLRNQLEKAKARR